MATRIVIMGGGPAGYEAALVAAQYGADVTLVEDAGIGGSCVLSDCVPSKTFIASAGGRTDIRQAGHLGIDRSPAPCRWTCRWCTAGCTGWPWPSPPTSGPG